MKQTLLLFYLLIPTVFFCQTTGVTITQTTTPNGFGTTITLTGGTSFQPPFTVEWTNSNGDVIQSCNSLDCNLNDEDPGRYCVTISTDNIDDEEGCEHNFASITKCIDIIGSTCPGDDEEEGLSGTVVADEEYLCGDQTTCVSFSGIFPDCLQGNLMFSWTNGESNQFSSDDLPFEICGVGPGTHCIKVTAMDENDVNDCEPACIGYFCTTVYTAAPEPLTVEADITPTVKCFNGSIISNGTIDLDIYGGLPPYKVRWLSNGSSDNTFVGNGSQCVEIMDNSLCPEVSSIFKCFAIPIRWRICQIKEEDPKDYAVSKTIKVYPNPAIHEIYCEFNSEDRSVKDLQVLNTEGRVVIEKKIETLANQHTERIEIENLRSGLYLLKIEGYEPTQFVIIK